MAYWNPERKLGVAGHFVEIIQLKTVILKSSEII